MSVTVERAKWDDPDVVAIMAAHKMHCHAISPPESCHAMAADEFQDLDAAVFVARHNGVTAGIGALKPLGADAGEIKSMHTLAPARGRGVAAKLLDAIMTEARRRGYCCLQLETGTQEAFRPARLLYERHGFERCAPFGAYRLDPLSTYYTKRLDADGGAP